MYGMWEIHHRDKHTKQQGRLYMIIKYFHLDMSIISTSKCTSCLSQELLKITFDFIMASWVDCLTSDLVHYRLHKETAWVKQHWREPDLLVAHLQTFRCSETLHSQEVKENRREGTYQVTHIIEQVRNFQELHFLNLSTQPSLKSSATLYRNQSIASIALKFLTPKGFTGTIPPRCSSRAIGTKHLLLKVLRGIMSLWTWANR